jgi:hypothetical protein
MRDPSGFAVVGSTAVVPGQVDTSNQWSDGNAVCAEQTPDNLSLEQQRPVQSSVSLVSSPGLGGTRCPSVLN